MLSQFFLLVGGFILLVFGADYLVKGAVSMARRLGVSSLVIGLTVVAIGTSTPELVVSLLSALRGSPEMALGNIFGSSIANVLLILGLTAIVSPVIVQKETVWKEIPFSLLASIVVVIMGSDVLLGGRSSNIISRADGLLLIAFGLAFLYYTYRTARPGTLKKQLEAVPSRYSWAYVPGGLVALSLGGKFIVDASVALARGIGVSEHLIGLTIVAIGTSLPELATSLVAAKRGQTDVAVGNVVGSNILNIFLILGMTAAISPMPFADRTMFDALVAVTVSLILFLAMFVGTLHRLDRWQGILFVASYVSFLGFSVVCL
jgi:cation:H+ antiporter